MGNADKIRKKEVERRYWVSCPGIANDSDLSGIELEPEENKRLQELEDKLCGEGFLYSDSGLVYKTYDLKDAEEKARAAQEIIKAAFPPAGENIVDEVGIVAQPVCPKCEELGRFSDLYCSSCGTELLPKEYVDI